MEFQRSGAKIKFPKNTYLRPVLRKVIYCSLISLLCTNDSILRVNFTPYALKNQGFVHWMTRFLII